MEPLSLIITITATRASLVSQLVRICLQCGRPQFNSWVRKIPWRRDRLPTPVLLGFPGSLAGKESIYSVRDLGSIPGLGRSPGEGNSYPLQYSGLENYINCYSSWGRKESDTIEWPSQYASKFGKLSNGHRTGKGQFPFQSQRRAMPKNVQTTAQLPSFHMLARSCSKSFKLGFNSVWSKNFHTYKLGLEKEEEADIQLPTSTGS